MSDPMHDALPHALRDVLAERPDGAELTALWHTLPTAPTAADDATARARRDVAWRRLSDRIVDPTRVPSPHIDEPAPLMLVDEGEADAARGRAVRPLPTPSTVTRVHTSTTARLWRAAAAFIALLGGTAVWQAIPQTFAVASGSTPTTVTLADGSLVTLAPGSALRVARGFRAWYGASVAERTVRLTGEAFFDVAHDGRAFTVETADATVRVLGTHFDVRSATATVGTRVLVDEGRVSVRGRADATTSVILAAGDAAIIAARGAVERIAVPSITRATNWRTGGLAAVNEPLGDVLAELARRAGVEITLDRDVAAASTVTLFYADAPSTERVLADLSAARALRFTRTSRGFRVSAGTRAP